MNTATATNDLVPCYEFIEDDTKHRWIYFAPHDLDYDVFKSFPKVVAYRGNKYQKMSFNTDRGHIAYKQVLHVATAA